MKRSDEIENKANSSSGLKTRLVIQDGAMRGLLGGGALMALDVLNLKNSYDVIFTS